MSVCLYAQWSPRELNIFSCYYGRYDGGGSGSSKRLGGVGILSASELGGSMIPRISRGSSNSCTRDTKL